MFTWVGALGGVALVIILVLAFGLLCSIACVAMYFLYRSAFLDWLNKPRVTRVLTAPLAPVRGRWSELVGRMVDDGPQARSFSIVLSACIVATGLIGNQVLGPILGTLQDLQYYGPGGSLTVRNLVLGSLLSVLAAIVLAVLAIILAILFVNTITLELDERTELFRKGNVSLSVLFGAVVVVLALFLSRSLRPFNYLLQPGQNR